VTFEPEVTPALIDEPCAGNLLEPSELGDVVAGRRSNQQVDHGEDQ
jgi:hypothetical protein